MLRGIPEIITPELLYGLSAMGHGDTLVLADANFPAYKLSRGHTLVHLPGVRMPMLLEAVLTLFPVDHMKENPAYVMQVPQSDLDRGIKTPIWDEYRKIVKDKTSREGLGQIERQKFYDLAAGAEVVVLTGETALYANVALFKGVL